MENRCPGPLVGRHWVYMPRYPPNAVNGPIYACWLGQERPVFQYLFWSMSNIYLLSLQGMRSFHERVNHGPVNCARRDSLKFLKFFFGCQRLFFLFWITGGVPVNTAIRIYFSLDSGVHVCSVCLWFSPSALACPVQIFIHSYQSLR